MIPNRAEIGQIAFIVRNLREAIQRWIQTTGAGPFYVIERPLVQNPRYLGKPCMADYAVAVGYAGALQIELIEVRNRTVSIFSKILDGPGEGFHHFMPLIADFDATLAAYDREGCPVVFTGEARGVGRVAFVDGATKFGGYIEVVEPSPLRERLQKQMLEESRNWDGSNPIRAFPLP